MGSGMNQLLGEAIDKMAVLTSECLLEPREVERLAWIMLRARCRLAFVRRLQLWGQRLFFPLEGLLTQTVALELDRIVLHFPSIWPALLTFGHGSPPWPPEQISCDAATAARAMGEYFLPKWRIFAQFAKGCATTLSISPPRCGSTPKPRSPSHPEGGK